MYLSLAANKTVKENYMCTGLDCILHRSKEGAQWHYLRMSNALYLWRFSSLVVISVLLSSLLLCLLIIIIKFHLEHLPGFLSPFQIADTALTADTRPWNEMYTLCDQHKTLSFSLCFLFLICFNCDKVDGKRMMAVFFFHCPIALLRSKKKNRFCWTRRWWIIAIISGVSHIYYYWHYAQTVVLSQSPRVTKCEKEKKKQQPTRYQSRKNSTRCWIAVTTSPHRHLNATRTDCNTLLLDIESFAGQ